MYSEKLKGFLNENWIVEESRNPLTLTDRITVGFSVDLSRGERDPIPKLLDAFESTTIFKRQVEIAQAGIESLKQENQKLLLQVCALEKYKIYYELHFKLVNGIDK